MFISCSWLVNDLFMTCLWLVHNNLVMAYSLFILFSRHQWVVQKLLDHVLFSTSLHNNHNLSIYDHEVFIVCTCHLMICSLIVHHLLTNCSWHVLDLLITCSLIDLTTCSFLFLFNFAFLCHDFYIIWSTLVHDFILF